MQFAEGDYEIRNLNGAKKERIPTIRRLPTCKVGNMVQNQSTMAANKNGDPDFWYWKFKRDDEDLRKKIFLPKVTPKKEGQTWAEKEQMMKMENLKMMEQMKTYDEPMDRKVFAAAIDDLKVLQMPRVGDELFSEQGKLSRRRETEEERRQKEEEEDEANETLMQSFVTLENATKSITDNSRLMLCDNTIANDTAAQMEQNNTINTMENEESKRETRRMPEVSFKEQKDTSKCQYEDLQQHQKSIPEISSDEEEDRRQDLLPQMPSFLREILPARCFCISNYQATFLCSAYYIIFGGIRSCCALLIKNSRRSSQTNQVLFVWGMAVCLDLATGLLLLLGNLSRSHTAVLVGVAFQGFYCMGVFLLTLFMPFKWGIFDERTNLTLGLLLIFSLTMTVPCMMVATSNYYNLKRRNLRDLIEHFPPPTK